MAQVSEQETPVLKPVSLSTQNVPAWVVDAIEMVEFIESNQLVLDDNSYDEYERLVLSSPLDIKLDRLYELLTDAMFVGSTDITQKYMEIYVSAVEQSQSKEHQQSLNVLNVATQGYMNWTYAETIDALEAIAFDEGMHPFARVRALAITGYLYGYSVNTDRIVTTIQLMERIAKGQPDNIFINKEIIGLKGFLAVHANDPEDMVKYSGEFLKLAYETESLIFGEVFSANFTHLVMEYGDIAAIDKIDAINQRIAHMTGKKSAIFKAYTSCGESAVKLVRLTRALKCFDEINADEDGVSQGHIRYYLYSAIAYARAGRVEAARRHLEKLNAIPDVDTSVYFEKTIDWANSEVMQAEGMHKESYRKLRSYFNDRLTFQKKELGEVTKSLRIYNDEKAALLEEKAEVLAIKEGLQTRIISRQRTFILFSIAFAAILLGFLQIQRKNTIRLRAARKRTIKANRAIMTESRTDQLTRIPNRRAFYEYCTAILENTDLREYTLGILDLDGFKLINDTFGHDAGDIMIQQTSQRLCHALEGYGRVFRLGGDEFAIIYIGQCNDELRQFRDRIEKALKAPVKIDSKSFDILWSAGAVIVQGENQDPLSFLYQADYALYQAKEQQGPSFHIFSDADLENINRDAYLADEVISSLTQCNFTMFGQIVVNSVNGVYQPFGVEALIRAETRSGEVIPPEDFISHAVSTGNASLVTGVTLKKSIEMLQNSDLKCPLLFNLSRRQIKDVNLLAIVNSTLEEMDFPPSRLIVELSERTLNQDLSAASQVLKGFKKAGIRIALDDFGSGNTGFASLLEFDFDIIKIDQSLLKRSMTSRRTRILLSNLLDLSHELNFLCILEGVQHPAEISFVEGLGGKVMQGYIFGRPEEIPKFRSNLNWFETTKVDAQDSDLKIHKKLA